MDQGRLKHNGNRDGRLTFGEAGGRLASDPGDPAGSLLQPAMHLPSLGSLPPSAVSSSGHGPSEDPLELGGFFFSDMKDGKGRMQKQPDLDLFSLESNLLKQSLPDSTSIITSSDASVLGNLPLPDLFPQHIKQEEMFGSNTAVGPSDLDSNSNQLLDDTAIWKALDLPCSLPEISDFELDTEVAHLDNILHECRSSGTPGSACPKDGKSGSDNGISSPNLNGTKHLVPQLSQQPGPLQPGSLLSSVTIKEEDKDPQPPFIHIRTPDVVKQERGDGEAFCQAACLQSGMSSGAMASLPVGLGPRSGHSYRANLASPMGPQDQKPFCLYPTLAVSSESWSAGGRYGDSAGIARADDRLPSTTVLGTFPGNFSR